MRKVTHLRPRKTTILGAAIATIVGVAALIAISQDAALSESVRAALTVRLESKLVPQQNAFYLAAGMRAPEDRAAVTVGMDIVSEMVSRQKADPADVLKVIMTSPRQGAIGSIKTTSGAPKELCDPVLKPCYAEHVAGQNQIDHLVAEHRVGLLRYRALGDFPGYEEPADIIFVHDGALIAKLLSLQNLALARATLEVSRGGTAESLNLIERELKAWRTIAVGSSVLAVKLIAISAITRAVRTLSEWMLNVPGFVDHGQTRILQMLASLQIGDITMDVALLQEFKFLAARVEMLPSAAVEPDIPSWGQRAPFLLKNATLNAAYDSTVQLVVLSKKSPNEIARLGRSILHVDSLAGAVWQKLVSLVHNRNGYAMLDRERRHLADKMLRLHDLDGLVRLVGLQLELSAQKVPVNDIGKFVAGAALRDPYTGQAMRWDASSRTLSAEVHSEERPSNSRVAIRLQ